jgi:hypothetical protein
MASKQARQRASRITTRCPMRVVCGRMTRVQGAASISTGGLIFAPSMPIFIGLFSSWCCSVSVVMPTLQVSGEEEPNQVQLSATIWLLRNCPFEKTQMNAEKQSFSRVYAGSLEICAPCCACRVTGSCRGHYASAQGRPSARSASPRRRLCLPRSAARSRTARGFTRWM